MSKIQMMSGIFLFAEGESALLQHLFVPLEMNAADMPGKVCAIVI
jgi:hypothetical protein